MFQMVQMLFANHFSLGKELNCISKQASIRSCGFSYSGNLFFFVTDVFKQDPSEIRVLDKRDDSHVRIL